MNSMKYRIKIKEYKGYDKIYYPQYKIFLFWRNINKFLFKFYTFNKQTDLYKSTFDNTEDNAKYKIERMEYVLNLKPTTSFEWFRYYCILRLTPSKTTYLYVE